MMAFDQMPGRLPSVHASDDPEKAPHLGGSVAVCEKSPGFIQDGAQSIAFSCLKKVA